MKNSAVAEFGVERRAPMAIVPLVRGSPLRASRGIGERVDFSRMSGVMPPPCTMKLSMTR